MNTLPQTPKSFDRFSGTQDHGTKDQAKGHDNVHDVYYTNHKRKLDQVMAQDDGTDAVLDTMTSDELEAAADEILGFYEPSALEEQAALFLEKAGNGRSDVAKLLNIYSELYQKMMRIMSGELQEDETSADAASLQEELDEIEGEIKEILAYNEVAPTINETGNKTIKEIRADLARAATLDPRFDEYDDYGDYNDSHIKIANRPR